jgi:kynurenine formamidase
LAATEAMAAFLWDSEIAAVAADNPAVEPVPADPGGGFLHRMLIPALGMPLGELWDLDELAEHAATTSSYESCLISIPLNVPGGVGSPANALAVV